MRRRREQHLRSQGRHDAWLTSLLQSTSSHHSGGAALGQLLQRVARLEAQVAKFSVPCEKAGPAEVLVAKVANEAGDGEGAVDMDGEAATGEDVLDDFDCKKEAAIKEDVVRSSFADSEQTQGQHRADWELFDALEKEVAPKKEDFRSSVAECEQAQGQQRAEAKAKVSPIRVAIISLLSSRFKTWRPRSTP